jgi:outer membrane protein assembly factor BamB
VAADNDGTIHTFVPPTGEPKWSLEADVDVLLGADEDAVYLVTKDQQLRAVGHTDATIRWVVRLPDDFRKRITARSPVGQGRLVVTTTSGHAMAVNTQSGRTEWTARNLAKKEYLFATVHNGVVHLSGKALSARRISDGK